MRKNRNEGISTIAGTILFIILIFVLQTTLFLMVHKYNNSMQDAINTETQRMQEKILLSSLKTDNSTGTDNLQALRINNTGAITVRIRAIYIDNQFWCDPSSASLNPSDTYINPKEISPWISLPLGKQYNATSTITALTERGTKSTELESKLKNEGGGPPPGESNKFYLGPLMLDFNEFYYALVYNNGSLRSGWREGWSVDANIPVAWNITVKNIDDRNITINQFSGFTLWTNDGQNNRRPWYFDPPGGLLTQRIAPNETVQLIYKWATPKTNQTRLPNTQSTLNVATSSGSLPCRTFLTFFGIFHESDGTTKPYGQTIPFEALLIERVTFAISASPNVIIIHYTGASTITANITRGGKPVAGQPVTFTTTTGTLSSPSAITDANGMATVYLTDQGVSSPRDATVTATWNFYSVSTTVYFVFETTTVTASPNVIPVNSTNGSTITATVLARGTPVNGANLTFSTDAGTLSSTWAITDSNGRATTYLTAGTKVATANVTAQWINTVSSTTVSFQTEATQLTASPTVIAANSTMRSIITAVVRFNGNPVTGANVTFATSAGTLSSAWAITDATGTARTYLYPSADPANATVTAKWTNALVLTTVSFEAATIQISASSTILPTNSTTNSIITVLAKLGPNPYTGANVTFSTTAGSLSRPWAITNASGYATVSLASSMSPTTASVTATWMSSSNSTSVRFTNLYVTTDRQEYAPNDIVKISGLLRYTNGTPIQGVIVSLNITASNGTVIWGINSTLTDTNGAFTYDLQLTNASPDVYTIAANYQTHAENYRKFTVVT